MVLHCILLTNLIRWRKQLSWWFPVGWTSGDGPPGLGDTLRVFYELVVHPLLMSVPCSSLLYIELFLSQ